MLIRNLSNRTLTFQDSAGTIYTATAYGDLTVSDALWADTEFRRNLRLRIREIEIESVSAGVSAPTDATYILTSTNAGLSAEKVLGTDIILKGTLAARPSASLAGRLYYVTDSGVERLSRDTGSVWEDFSVGYGFVTGKTHNTTHIEGGSDQLSGNLAAVAKVNVRKNSSTAVGTRRGINFIEGVGITLTAADDAANERINLTITGAAPASSTIPYGTALPGSPTDGQQYILVDSVSAPTYRWHFRYNQSSASVYKWEFIGGTEAVVEVATSQTSVSNTYAALATVGPSFTIPREGDWEVTASATMGSTSAASPPMMSYDVGGTGANDAWAVGVDGNPLGGASRKRRFASIAASTALVSKYKRTAGSGTATFANRTLHIVPVRVI